MGRVSLRVVDGSCGIARHYAEIAAALAPTSAAAMSLVSLSSTRSALWMAALFCVSLNNRITIEVHACSFRTVRGYTIVAALLDELAFRRSDEDSSNPQVDVV